MQLIENYNRLREALAESGPQKGKGLKLPALETVRATITSETFTDAGALWAHLQQLPITEGWYQTPSKQGVVLQGNWPDLNAPMLQGEFCNEQSSWRVVYNGAVWVLSVVCENAAEGECFIATQQTYLADFPGIKKLSYRVYSLNDDVRGPVIIAAGLKSLIKHGENDNA